MALRSYQAVKTALLATPIAFAAFSNTAHADVVGGEVSVSYWSAGYGGDVTDRQTKQTIDLEQDLNFDSSSFVEFSAAIEHPIPVLPNLKLKHIDLDDSADGALSVTVFDGVTFSGDVASDLDLTHSSAILYYEVLDNVVSLDLGLEIKLFDGQLRIEDKTTNLVSETKIDDPIPLAYVAADVDLPLTGLTVGAELSAIGYSGNRLLDARAAVRYSMGLLFVEGGYRTMQITVDDVNDVDVDADLSGAFISTGIDF